MEQAYKRDLEGLSREEGEAGKQSNKPRKYSSLLVDATKRLNEM